MRKSLYLLNFIVLLTGGFGCSGGDTSEAPPPPPVTIDRVLPVTMIEQDLPLPLEQSWQLVTLALEQQDIPLSEVIEDEALIITEWIPMQDRLCTTVTAATTPLECETQYRLSLFPANDTNSVLRIRYVEDCTGEHQLYLTCPNSTAERRMIQIIGDIKALAGIK